jgi:Flp pilus assembly pilin Flp
MRVNFQATAADRERGPCDGRKGEDMKATKNFIQKLWNDERGQSTTEYILILSVVVMIAMKFKQKIGDKIDGLVDKVGADIDKNITN